MMKPRTLAVVLGVLALSLAGEARADAVIEFTGAHPIDPALAKGMCFIEGPHVHSYQPHKAPLYVQAPGGWAFVGDPVEFEPDAPKFGYYGHHPLFWMGAGEHYCYISGAHSHWYAPPATLEFKMKGGVYWYVGKHPHWYKAKVHKHLDHHYAAVHFWHPVVTVAPPVGFVGVVGPGVVVAAPGVVVAPPTVGVVFPGMVVGPGHPHGKVKVKHGGPWGAQFKHHGRGHGKGRWK